MSHLGPNKQVPLINIFQCIAKVTGEILLLDAGGNILEVDRAIGQQLGYALRALRDKRLTQLSASLSEKHWKAWWKKAAAKGAGELDLSLTTAEGQSLPANLKASFFTLDDDILALGKIHFNSEASLLPLLQRCARMNRCAVWQWDLIDGKFSVSDHFYEIFELQVEEGLANRTNIVQLLKDRLSIAQMQQMTAGLSNLRQMPNSIEHRLTLSWGTSKKTIEFRANSIQEDGRISRLTGLIREILPPDANVTDSGPILDRASAMVCFFQEDGTLTYVNRAMYQALDYRPEEMVGHISVHQIDIENGPSQWKSFRHSLETEDHCKLETSFQRNDGTLFPIEATLIRLDDGLTGMMAKDITAQRKEESRLKAALLEINSLTRQLEAENTYLQEEVYHHFENIISNSVAYEAVLHQVRQVAPTDSTVLIQGESGTGKELLAHAIHRLSKRKERTLVKVNCAALPSDLIESELFGHEKGAFTGADRNRVGRFELADGGTIFLDEIGEIPPDVQVKLLRVIQEGELQRVGSSDTLTVDVRIIAATNRNLEQMIQAKAFREDLYYRLSVFPIENLPLRERKEDISLLLRHFLQKHSKRMGKDIRKVSEEDLKRLEAYSFPGNVRELENIVERAVILTRGNTLDLSFWKPNHHPSPDEDSPTNSRIKTMVQMQHDLIIRALEASNWTVSGPNGAAKLLDMHPQTLHSRMRKLGIKLKK